MVNICKWNWVLDPWNQRWVSTRADTLYCNCCIGTSPICKNNLNFDFLNAPTYIFSDYITCISYIECSNYFKNTLLYNIVNYCNDNNIFAKGKNQNETIAIFFLKSQGTVTLFLLLSWISFNDACFGSVKPMVYLVKDSIPYIIPTLHLDVNVLQKIEIDVRSSLAN